MKREGSQEKDQVRGGIVKLDWVEPNTEGYASECVGSLGGENNRPWRGGWIAKTAARRETTETPNGLTQGGRWDVGIGEEPRWQAEMPGQEIRCGHRTKQPAVNGPSVSSVRSTDAHATYDSNTQTEQSGAEKPGEERS